MNVDLLLLDWDMPGASGFEVLKTMRRQGYDTPTIMVTAKNERDHAIRFCCGKVNLENSTSGVAQK